MPAGNTKASASMPSLKITPLSGEPSTLTVIHIGKVRTSATPRKAQAAKNLPRIASHGEIGSVMSSSVVPDGTDCH